jgi:hypothetical protein
MKRSYPQYLFTKCLEYHISKTHRDVNNMTNVLLTIILESCKNKKSQEAMAKIKYTHLQSSLANIFLQESVKEELMAHFHAIQRRYHILYRFSLKIKYHLLERYRQHNSMDLLGNPLKLSQKSCIGICQLGTLFLFSRRDIIQLMNNALGHSSQFFSEPFHIMNPYNRVFFSKTAIQNLYWFVKDGDLPISNLIHAFHDCRFDMHKFETKYSYLLRENAIDSFLKNAGTNDQVEYIQEMVADYNDSVNIDKHIFIPDDYLDEKLVRDCKPYLDKYLRSMYSFHTSKTTFRREWLREFREYVALNMRFGKKIYFHSRFRNQHRYNGNRPDDRDQNRLNIDSDDSGDSSSSNHEEDSDNDHDGADDNDENDDNDDYEPSGFLGGSASAWDFLTALAIDLSGATVEESDSTIPVPDALFLLPPWGDDDDVSGSSTSTP